MRKKNCVLVEFFVLCNNVIQKVQLKPLEKNFMEEPVKSADEEKIKFYIVNLITINNLLEV